MRLIDADKLAKDINSLSTHLLNEWDTMGILIQIDEQPTVDAVPTEFHDRCMQIEIEKRFELELKEKHGHWIGENGWVCSECGYRIANWKFSSEYLYCPNCGAKMDEVKEDGA